MEVVDRSRYPVAPYQYLARTGSGHTPSRSNDDYWVDTEIPWLTTSDVKRLRSGVLQVLEDTEHHISELGMANSAARLHPKGTVALSRTASVGFSVIMGVPMATSQDFVTWTPGPELDSRYLLLVLRAMKGCGDLDSLMYGSTHNTIYVPDLQRLRGPVPPLEEQGRIADYLDAETSRIDSLIATNQQAVTLLEERRSAVALGATGFGGSLRPLRYAVERSVGGVWGSEAGEDDIDVTVLRAADFDRVHHRLDPRRAPVRSISMTQLRSRRLRAGDLVLEKSGGGDTQPVGCVALFEDGDGPTVPSNFNALLRPRADVDPWYLNVVLAGMYRSGRSRQYVNQTTGIQNVDLQAFMGQRVPIPDLYEQRSIARSVQRDWDALDQTVRGLERQSDLLRERRHALVMAAVTGEIEV